MHGILVRVATEKLVLAALVSLSAGCVPSTASEEIVVQQIAVETRHPHSVSVRVSGGKPSTATHPAQISNSVLSRAIEETIRISRVFVDLHNQNSADYTLDVNIFQIEQPAIAFTKRVFIEIGWTLTRPATNTRIWQKATKTTSIGEDLKSTTERAARENVRHAIEQISRLRL